MRKLLVVDDTIDICILLKEIFKLQGLTADYVKNIADALEAVSRENYSIIFLDNRLPDGLGIENITKIKEHCRGAKIIIITAFSDEEGLKKAMDDGAHAVIAKPFTIDTILKTIERL